MKTILLSSAAALLLVTTPAQAGGLAPVIEPAPIVMAPVEQSSPTNVIVPIIFIALIALAASRSGGNEDGGPATDLPQL